jgi:hypothetical protein
MAGTMACLKWGLCTSAEGKKGLTLNLEYNAGCPCASCYRYDELFHVPNGEAGGAHECLIVEDNWIGKQDVRAEHDQERSGGGS